MSLTEKKNETANIMFSGHSGHTHGTNMVWEHWRKILLVWNIIL